MLKSISEHGIIKFSFLFYWIFLLILFIYHWANEFIFCTSLAWVWTRDIPSMFYRVFYLHGDVLNDNGLTLNKGFHSTSQKFIECNTHVKRKKKKRIETQNPKCCDDDEKIASIFVILNNLAFLPVFFFFFRVESSDDFRCYFERNNNKKKGIVILVIHCLNKTYAFVKSIHTSFITRKPASWSGFVLKSIINNERKKTNWRWSGFMQIHLDAICVMSHIFNQMPANVHRLPTITCFKIRFKLLKVQLFSKLIQVWHKATIFTYPMWSKFFPLAS